MRLMLCHTRCALACCLSQLPRRIDIMTALVCEADAYLIERLESLHKFPSHFA